MDARHFQLTEGKMHPDLLAAIESRSSRYVLQFAGNDLHVRGFHQAAAEPGGLSSLVEEFSSDILIDSGLFYHDTREPVIAPGGLFRILRDPQNAYLDVFYEGDSATGILPPLQVLGDARFLDARNAGARICFVQSMYDMALLRAARIRVCPTTGLLRATREELNMLAERLHSLQPNHDNPGVIIFADWSPYATSYTTSTNWQEVLSFAKWFQAVANPRVVIYLWRPNRTKMQWLELARKHNYLWTVELLCQSLAQDLRPLGEQDRPLEEGGPMVLYNMRRLYQSARNVNPVEAIGGHWSRAKQDFLRSVTEEFATEGLAHLAGDSPNDARLFAAKLSRYAALLKLPELLRETSKLSSWDVHHVASLANSPALREMLEAAKDMAQVARDILNDSKRR